MSSIRIGASVLVLSLIGAVAQAAPVQPAKVGLFGAPSAKRQAKEELHSFLSSTRVKGQAGSLMQHRNKLLRNIPTVVKTLSLTIGAASVPASQVAGLMAAFSNHSGNGAAGITLGVGAASVLGGFKIAQAITRNANTMAVQHAMENGVSISSDQLTRWSSAKLIKTVPTASP